MGDCRLRFLVAKDLLDEVDGDWSLSSTWQSQTRIFSADTTIREVFEVVLFPLKWKHVKTSREEFPKEISVWDCTLHPPKNITEWPSKDFSEKVGSKSKTLYNAGWFPSGTLQIVHSKEGNKLASAEMYDDAQYNITTKVNESQETGSPHAVVLLSGNTSGPIKPSEVIQNVKARFEGEKQVSERDALDERRRKLLERKQKESQRNRKLEERIQHLNQSNSKTSKQVRRMLIKNRCTGARLLDVKDRVYLHCVGISGDATKEDYCFFSRQDTVSKVIASLKKPLSLPPKGDAELLVKSQDAEFHRLPPTMRLYEALSKDFLQEVDSIVIRNYSGEIEEPTSSVLDDNSNDINDELAGVERSESIATDDEKNESAMDTTSEDVSEDLPTARIQNMLQRLDDAEACTKGKKKKSATSAKVRSMLMKSKAFGDKKRVSNMTNRFFFEMVLFHACDDKKEPSTKPIFMAKTDQVGRILRDFVPSISSELSSMVLTPVENNGFRKIPFELTWQEAEKKGLVKQFDRIIVHLYK